MNSVYRYSTLLICLLFVIASYGQLNSGNLTQYTEKDGLPGVQVSSLLIDRFGYVWAGTINGLVRYDGYEFKRFYSNPNDTTSIHGLPVYSLFEDHTGQIWIGTGPSSLNVYDPVYKIFKQYPFRDLISHPANIEPDITSFCEDNNGRIYIGVDTYGGQTISSALLYKDEKDEKLKVFPAPDSLAIQNVFSLQKDPSGNIWCISYSGTFKIDTKGNLTSAGHSLRNEIVRNHDVPKDARFDKQGNLWIITGSDRLYEFNPATESYKSWLPDINPGSKNASLRKTIAIDKDDNIWLATDDGIRYFNRKENQFSSFNNGIKKELEHVRAIELKFDSFGTLWIGTNADGLIRNENRPQLKSYVFNKADKNSITPGWASAVYEATDGKVWILTTGSGEPGINILDTRTGRIVQARSSSLSAKNPAIFSIWENAPGEFYIGTLQGTYALSNKTYNIKPVTLPGVPNSAFVRSHFTDSRGNEWLCTPLGMYKRGRGSIEFKQYDLSKVHAGNAASNTVTHVYEGKNNGLWLFTDNGLYLYDYKTGTIDRHGYDEQSGDVFISQDVNSLYEDKSGIAWVGTWQGGLSRYDVKTKKIKTYTQEDGLPSMCIQSIIADEKNNSLWLSTFDGLSRFDLKTGQFNNFSVADGIQGQLFADGAALKTSTGSFLFGGSNGITIFDPDEINQNSIPPKVFLTDLKLFNKSVIPGSKSVLKKPIDETSRIILPYNQNTLSIEFIALHYSNPLKNRYSYKLDHYDNEWRDVGNLHVAFYPKLSPGEYVFRVKAANDKGVWNETGATLTIIINRPWWKTTWAYVLYAALLLGIGLAVNSYIRRRLLEKEREKSRARELEQAREIEKAYYKLEETHEALKAAQARLIQSEKMASLGELTAGIAHEIQNPLNFMNNFSEVNKDMIDELQTELKAGNFGQAIRILTEIKENEEKINHHGMRADAIVKGMLQHSRISTGVEEPTDINKLADEFLRLAYHGIRAKDKNFTAELKTNFDKTIGKINIVPQDIGRVLLNLLNNAFYAANQKQKDLTGFSNLAGQQPYVPMVTIVTKKLNDKIEIKVIDNGNGIPQKIIDKIFQPFFTTKPTGQGTGLGLSLAYDIIKAHGGEIKVETKEGEGSEFIIQLPV